METSEKLKFSDKIINSLRNAAKELEELRVQAALGTAEAREAFEEAKKSYNKFAHEAKLNLDSLKDLAQDKSIALKTLFETIQVKLALGKAETKDDKQEEV